MSSSQKAVTNVQKEESSFELTSIIFSSTMIFFSVVIILLNWRLFQRLRSRRKHPNVRKLRRMLIKGRLAVKTGTLTAIETVILALEAGMTLDEVRMEYVNENGPRENTLESVFGNLTDKKFFNQLTASGRFMETGYANEKIFLDLWKCESYRELVLTTQRPECPTQTYIIPNNEITTATTNTTLNTSTTNKTSDSKISAAPKKSQRKSIIDKTAAALLPEKAPLLCSGKNDDAN